MREYKMKVIDFSLDRLNHPLHRYSPKRKVERPVWTMASFPTIFRPAYLYFHYCIHMLPQDMKQGCSTNIESQD